MELNIEQANPQRLARVEGWSALLVGRNATLLCPLCSFVSWYYYRGEKTVGLEIGRKTDRLGMGSEHVCVRARMREGVLGKKGGK